MLKTTLVQLHSSGRLKVMNLSCEGAVVSRSWGLLDGQFQDTSNTYDYINKGKSNELSPEEAAEADYYRIISIREKEGYVKVDSLDKLPKLTPVSMDFDELPVEFCCSKPYTSVKKKVCDKLLDDGDALIYQKENGLCHFVLITESKEVKIYTRRIDDHTKKYPKIVAAFEELNLPERTLIVVEFTVDPNDMFKKHMDRFRRVSSISRSDTVKGKVKDDVTTTLSLQEETPVIAIMFNMLFLNGEDLTKKRYDEVIDILTDIESYDTSGFVRTPLEWNFSSYDEIMQYAKENSDNIEGFVLWVASENAEITYNGKPNRRACYKLKAVQEDDVIAYGYIEGSGAKQGKVGSLLIGKYNSDMTNLIPMGKVGSGLKIKEGECEVAYWTFPCVVAIEYEQRFDTGAYQFPRFLKKHEDKKPEDVIADEDGF